MAMSLWPHFLVHRPCIYVVGSVKTQKASLFTDSIDLLIYVAFDVTGNDVLPVSNENNTTGVVVGVASCN